jgi:hypothetical protein
LSDFLFRLHGRPDTSDFGEAARDSDLFRTTHTVKTQQVIKSRGHHCGDIELAGYLANATGPVPLVLDLRIVHDRVGSSTDPTLNGHLKYPNNLDQSLNDAAADKIRKYRADYNNNPPSVVSFMPAIASTYGRLHSEFVRLLFLQTHRETDRFFASIFRYFSSSSNPVYARHVDSSSLGFSLSSHRQSCIGLVFSSRFID